MYTTVFGLTRHPFGGDPESDRLFRTPELDEAHSRLRYLVEHRALGVLTGEPGTGKSTALRRLRDELHPEQVRALYLHDTELSARDLCQQIALELGLQPQISRAQSLRSIQNEIRRLATERRLTVLLVLDEAQNLRPQVLALLSTLTSFDWDATRHLALLLAGQLGLRQRLRMAHLEALDQRITVRFNLAGFDRETTQSYLEHRLQVAGATRPLFCQPAVEALFNVSQGIMRRIDTLAHNALAVAATRKAQIVDADHVLQAAQEMRS